MTLASTKGILCFPQPRSYEETHEGASPTSDETLPVRAGIDTHRIAAAIVELKRQVQQEVMYPLERWLAAYRTIKVDVF